MNAKQADAFIAEQQAKGITIYDIAAARIAALEETFAAMNRKAKKLGNGGGASFAIVGEYTSIRVVGENRFLEPLKVEERRLLVTVQGITPKIAGWAFVAHLEPVAVGSNLIKAMPDGGDIPVRFRTADMTCDHCRTKRARSGVYVLRHEDGRYIQVGRQCLKDFLGDSTPESIATMLQFDARLREAMNGADSGGTILQPLEYLSVVAAVIRHYGWVSRGMADVQRGQPTADVAWDFLTFDKTTQAMLREGFNVRPEDAKTAEAALAWARTLEPKSDFLHNIQAVALGDGLTAKSIGFAAAIIPAYGREQEQAIRNAKRAEARGQSQWVGTVGARQTFDVTVVGVSHFDTAYGTMAIIRMADAQGNTLVWKTTSGDMEQGEEATIKATIKAHDTYRDEKQTVLTRVAYA